MDQVNKWFNIKEKVANLLNDELSSISMKISEDKNCQRDIIEQFERILTDKIVLSEEMESLLNKNTQEKRMKEFKKQFKNINSLEDIKDEIKVLKESSGSFKDNDDEDKEFERKVNFLYNQYLINLCRNMCPYGNMTPLNILTNTQLLIIKNIFTFWSTDVNKVDGKLLLDYGYTDISFVNYKYLLIYYECLNNSVMYVHKNDDYNIFGLFKELEQYIDNEHKFISEHFNYITMILKKYKKNITDYFKKEYLMTGLNLSDKEIESFCYEDNENKNVNNVKNI